MFRIIHTHSVFAKQKASINSQFAFCMLINLSQVFYHTTEYNYKKEMNGGIRPRFM